MTVDASRSKVFDTLVIEREEEMSNDLNRVKDFMEGLARLVRETSVIMELNGVDMALFDVNSGRYMGVLQIDPEDNLEYYVSPDDEGALITVEINSESEEG